MRVCVDLISCISLETYLLAVLLLDQCLRRFDFLYLIRDSPSCHICAGSVRACISFSASHWRLTFLPCLCWISKCVDLISCNALETDILAVLVLNQRVRGFDFLQHIGG